MPVNPRGGSWQASIAFKGQRYRKNFDTEAAAQQWHDETLQSLKEGRPLDDAKDRKPRTMGELADYVWDTHWKTMPCAVTMVFNVQAIKDGLGYHRPITEVGRFHIDKLVQGWREKGNSDATLTRKLACLKKMLSVAVELEILTRKPVFPTFKQADHRTRVITPEEETRMLAFFELRSDRAMVDYISVSIDTGIRRGELLKLNRTNIQGDFLRLHGEQTKNGKRRSIPLTPRARAILSARASDAPDDRTPLYGDLRGRRANDAWNEGRAHLGLSDDEEFVPHTMRHTFCSRLARLGFNAQTIQAMSGHETLEMLKRYTHMDEDTLSQAIERLGARFTLGVQDSSQGPV